MSHSWESSYSTYLKWRAGELKHSALSIFPYTGDCHERHVRREAGIQGKGLYLTKARLHVESQNLRSIRCKDRHHRCCRKPPEPTDCAIVIATVEIPK